MWREFSQPINPDWKRDGKLCKVGGMYHGTEFCAESRLKRREEITRKTWDDLPDEIVDRVRLFQAGLLDKPTHWESLKHGRISNWSSAQLKNIASHHPQGYELSGEWFFEDTRLLAGEVKVAP
jgi:hypothetical protein